MFALPGQSLVGRARRSITRPAASAFPTTSDYLLFGNRLVFPNGISPSTGAQYGGNWMVVQAPPWDTVSPRLGFVGFYGLTANGETAIGNDVPYEAALIEINDTKYYLPAATGQDTASAHAFTVPNGAHLWTAENAIFIPANAIIRIGWADAQPSTANNRVSGVPAAGASIFATASGRGDFGSLASTSRLSAIVANTTGTIAAPGLGTSGSNFSGAPAAMVARPATAADAAKARAVLGVGMSIDWGRNHQDAFYGTDAAHSMAYGGFGYGFADPANGRVPYAAFSVPGSRALDITNAGSPGNAANGWSRRDAFFAAVGYPWTHAIMGGPINDIAAYSLATVTANIDAALAAMKARGGRKMILTTARPQTNTLEETGTAGPGAANGFLFTGGDNHQFRGADSVHAAYDTYAMAKPANVDFVLDIRPAHESSAGSRKWKSGPSTTLTQAAAGAPASVVGSIAAGSNILTVESVGSGTLAVDQRVTVAGLPSNTFVTGLGTGTGGTGTYTLSANATAAVSSATLAVTGVYRITVADASAIAQGDFIAINPGTSPAASEQAIVTTKAGNVLTLKGGLTKPQASGATVTVIWTPDGTHISTASAKAEGALVDARKAEVLA
jgi:hypothetical protein